MSKRDGRQELLPISPVIGYTLYYTSKPVNEFKANMSAYISVSELVIKEWRKPNKPKFSENSVPVFISFMVWFGWLLLFATLCSSVCANMFNVYAIEVVSG